MRRTIISIGFTLAALALVAIPLLASQYVDWEPKEVNRVLAVGDRVPVRLTLHVLEHLPKTIVEVTPSLDEWTACTPNELPVLSAGTEVTIDCVLSAPFVGIQDGTLKIREASPKSRGAGKKSKKPKVFSKPLPFVITGVATLEESLPPEPDPELNNATLEGVDSNGDGVRDDVERYIKLNWTEPLEREALLGYAAMLEKVLLHQATPQEWVNADACVRAALHPDSTATPMFEIVSRVRDTDPRAIAYRSFQEEAPDMRLYMPGLTLESCGFWAGGVL